MGLPVGVVPTGRPGDQCWWCYEADALGFAVNWTLTPAHAVLKFVAAVVKASYSGGGFGAEKSTFSMPWSAVMSGASAA